MMEAQGVYQNFEAKPWHAPLRALSRKVFGPWTGFESQSVTLMVYARDLELPQSIALAFLNAHPRMGSMYNGFP